MAKANLTLPNGTQITIEGTAEEVQALLDFYGTTSTPRAGSPSVTRTRKRKKARGSVKTPQSEGPDLNEIVNLVKTCEEAEAIERQILDRPGQVNRTLLPLYIVHEHLANAWGLTSGDVNKITTELGIPISTPHASTTLSKTASRYVVGDAVRKKGRAVRYKLSRRGVHYMKGIVSGNGDED